MVILVEASGSSSVNIVPRDQIRYLFLSETSHSAHSRFAMSTSNNVVNNNEYVQLRLHTVTSVKDNNLMLFILVQLDLSYSFYARTTSPRLLKYCRTRRRLHSTPSKTRIPLSTTLWKANGTLYYAPLEI